MHVCVLLLHLGHHSSSHSRINSFRELHTYTRYELEHSLKLVLIIYSKSNVTNSNYKNKLNTLTFNILIHFALMTYGMQ